MSEHTLKVKSPGRLASHVHASPDVIGENGPELIWMRGSLSLRARLWDAWAVLLGHKVATDPRKLTVRRPVGGRTDRV